MLLTGMLAGCGNANSNGTDESASTNNGGAANKGAEAVNLRLYTYGTEETYNWKATLDAYHKANPNVTVELVQLSEKGDTQEATKKLDLAAASGEQIDMMMFSDPASYSQRVALGIAAPS